MKKILAFALTALMITAATTSAFAAAGTGDKITGMSGSLSLGHSGSTDLGEIAPVDSRIETIDLLDTMFTWDGYEPDPASPTQLTSAQIRAAKLTVRHSGGAKAVDSVTINNRDGRIEVAFVDEYVSTKELDFTVDIYLVIDGKRQSDNGVTLTGTLANPVQEVYADEDYVDISDGSVVHAMEFNTKVQLDLGNGVSVNAKLFKDKKYYGTAKHTASDRDATLEKYPEISEALTLQTIGLNSTGSKVRLDGSYASYYVYNKDLQLLGRGSDLLEYSAIYYLSVKQLDIKEEVLEDFTKSINGNGQNEEPGLTNTTWSNVNDNPGTGR